MELAQKPERMNLKMLRVIVLSAVAAVSVGMSTATAEPLWPVSKKSPGEIAAASRLLAEKQEGCRLEAKRQKLTLLKRRSFIRQCKKTKI
jgi:hypothetical protein